MIVSCMLVHPSLIHVCAASRPQLMVLCTLRCVPFGCQLDRRHQTVSGIHCRLQAAKVIVLSDLPQRLPFSWTCACATPNVIPLSLQSDGPQWWFLEPCSVGAAHYSQPREAVIGTGNLRSSTGEGRLRSYLEPMWCQSWRPI